MISLDNNTAIINLFFFCNSLCNDIYVRRRNLSARCEEQSAKIKPRRVFLRTQDAMYEFVIFVGCVPYVRTRSRARLPREKCMTKLEVSEEMRCEFDVSNILETIREIIELFEVSQSGVMYNQT